MKLVKALLLCTMVATLALMQAFGPRHVSIAEHDRADTHAITLAFCATEAPPSEILAEMQRIYGTSHPTAPQDGSNAEGTHCPVCTLQAVLSTQGQGAVAVHPLLTQDPGLRLLALELSRNAPSGAPLGLRTPPCLTL